MLRGCQVAAVTTEWIRNKQPARSLVLLSVFRFSLFLFSTLLRRCITEFSPFSIPSPARLHCLEKGMA
jgi:hypothetical protein